MGDNIYFVVATGDLKKGVDETTARIRLADSLQVEPERLSPIFAGGRILVKSSSDIKIAKTYLKLLNKAGVVAELQTSSRIPVTAGDHLELLRSERVYRDTYRRISNISGMIVLGILAVFALSDLGISVHHIPVLAENYAKWSIGWIMPAAFFWILLAFDKNETKTEKIRVSEDPLMLFNTKRIFINRPTGNIIEGDPELAAFFFWCWLVGYPLGCRVFNIWINHDHYYLTGYPNLDFLIICFGMPLTLIVGVPVALVVLRKKAGNFLVSIKALTKIAVYLALLDWLYFAGKIILAWLTER